MSEQPRLLFCCFDVVPGPFALSRRLTQYLEGLSDHFQVVVLSNKTPDHSHIEKYAGARLLRVPIGSGDLVAQVQSFERAVRRQLESEEYLLVHFFDPFGGYPMCEAKGEFGYKAVYDATSFASLDFPGRYPSIAEDRRFLARARRQELYCLMNADAVVVGSEVTKSWVAGLGVDMTNVHVIRAPVDASLYTSEVMGLPDATPMKIVHLGGLQSWHGLKTLLEAMHLALQTQDLRLAVVGPRLPELQAPLEVLVRELKLTGKVEFQDPVAHDDLHKILATADVGAVTMDDTERTRTIGTSLARLGEYLAAGRPVIAADLPVAHELVPKGAGVFYEPGDAHGLAAALASLAADPRRRREMGSVARKFADRFDAGVARKELLSLYGQVTGLIELVSEEPAPEDAPYESTQVGFQPPGGRDPSEVTQVAALPVSASPGPGVAAPAVPFEREEEDEKEPTDPAIARAAASEGATDPGMPTRDRAAVMGVPLRDETPPHVPAPELPPEPTPIAVRPGERLGTDPAVPSSGGPMVVLGTPERVVATGAPRPPAGPAEIPAEGPGAQGLAGAHDLEAPTSEVRVPGPDEPVVLPGVGARAPLPSLEGPTSEVRVPSVDERPSVPLAPARPPAPMPDGPTDEVPSPVTEDAPIVPGAMVLQPPPVLQGKPLGERAPDLADPKVPQPPPVFHGRPLERTPDVPGLAAPASPAPGDPSEPPIVRGAAVPPVLGFVPTAYVPAAIVHGAATGDKPAPARPPTTGDLIDSIGAPSPLSSAIPPVPAPRAEEPLPVVAGTLPGGELLVPGPGALRREPGIIVGTSLSAPPVLLPSAPPAPVPPSAPRPAPPQLAAPAPRPNPAPTPHPPGPAPAQVGVAPTATSAVGSAPASAQPPPPAVNVSLRRESSGSMLPLRGPSATMDEAEEISSDEIQDVAGDDGPDEVMEADDLQAQQVDTQAGPPPSALDPWLAQLVHGYCPPQSDLFKRHVPPTTMPGRDQ